MAPSFNGIPLSSKEILEAQAQIWNLIFNYMNSMSLKCAIQLGIPDAIRKHGKPISLLDLSHLLSIEESKISHLKRVMDILIHSKLFIKSKIDETEEQGYWLTPLSHLLLQNQPLNVAPFALMLLDPILVDPWHNIAKWFLNKDASPFVTTNGRTIYEHAAHVPRLNLSISEAMASDAEIISRVIVEDCKHVFEGLSSMIDVGGSTGVVAKRFPNIKCIVLDLPHVVDGLKGGEKLEFVSGDMFEYIPPADAIFMKWILHNWTDEECVKILENCKASVGSRKDKKGKVILVDVIIDYEDEDKVLGTKLFFDELMLVECNGRERTENDYAKLFFAAGFASYKISSGLGMRSIIEVFT